MEFEVGGKKYRTARKLDAFVQLHVARRLSPVLLAWTEGLAGMAAKLGFAPKVEGADIDPVGGSVLVAGVSPILAALAKMPQDDVDYVLQMCLGVVEREVNNGWAKVTATNGKMMMEDLGMTEMVALVQMVVKENLGDFFPGVPGGPG